VVVVKMERSCVGSSGTSVGWYQIFVKALIEVGGYSQHCGQLALDVKASLEAKCINTNTLCFSGDTRTRPGIFSSAVGIIFDAVS